MNSKLPVSNEAIQNQTEAAIAGHSEIFIARQPIFDSKAEVFAYELLYRSGHTATAGVIDGNAASSQVILNAFVDMDIDEITDSRLAFVNLTTDFLYGKLPLPLPAGSLVIEVLEDIEVDDALVDALHGFAKQGYTIALDDYAFAGDRAELLECVDIVKLEYPAFDEASLREAVARLKQFGVKLLAEKVETQADYELCRELGFDYFQGYFFSKPKIMSGQAIKPNRLPVLRALAILQDPDCDINELEQLISNDVSMSYKILRIINSALYNIPRTIDSVKQAITALGLKAIREWMVIITLTDVDDKPRELVNLCLQRARMMQLLAEARSLNPDVSFTTGLFSAIDALMDQKMEDVLRELPLADEVVAALLRQEGILGRQLLSVIQFERADWDAFDCSDEELDSLQDSYQQAMQWSRELFSQLSSN
jgi:EAL and modified HD-GYP domain-containing signal transduction protein